MATGTKEDPFTHGIVGVSRQFKFCKCAGCGVVARCEPRFDFYTPCVAGEHVLDGPLQCEKCALGGMPVIDFTHKAQS